MKTGNENWAEALSQNSPGSEVAGVMMVEGSGRRGLIEMDEGVAGKGYLGVPVGGNMSSIKSWDDIIRKIKSRLSKRKGFFYGAQANERKIAWVKWSKVLSSKKNGGFGVSSFYALNRTLLFKWVWRFISQDNSLWARVVSTIHGPTFQVLAVSDPSLWNSIVREIHVLKSRGIDLVSYCKKRVGNCLRTRFWEEVWIGDQNLSNLFPRIFALENDKSCTVAAKLQDGVRGGVEAQQLSQIHELISSSYLANMEDCWVWTLNGNGLFRVSDIRILIDDFFLPKEEVATRWIKYFPIKINIFAWKVSLDRLPTRLNLVHRGVQVSSLDCPVCSLVHGSSSHILFSCYMATDIARLICRWWDLRWSPFGSYVEWFSWFKNVKLGSILKDILEGVFYVAWWSIWIFRNQLLFASRIPRKNVLFDDIVPRSFMWCNARCKEEKKKTVASAFGEDQGSSPAPRVALLDSFLQ
nr:hypothetical protein [Tanacetum cinerariifolium]